MINNGYYPIMNNKATTIEGNVKILYGLIGGVQTIVNMLSSLLDIYYFGREFKIIKFRTSVG